MVIRLQNTPAFVHFSIYILFVMDLYRKDLARVYNDLFERRQEGDYVDFVFFKEKQIQPWLLEGKRFVQEITILINQRLPK